MKYCDRRMIDPWSYNLYDGGHVALEGDVVVVSCNYRLEVLGALVHDGDWTATRAFSTSAHACSGSLRPRIRLAATRAR